VHPDAKTSSAADTIIRKVIRRISTLYCPQIQALTSR
jgi:hypothetical protein